MYELVTRGTYTTPAHLSKPVKDILSRMLTVEPQKRSTIKVNVLLGSPSSVLWLNQEKKEKALCDRSHRKQRSQKKMVKQKAVKKKSH
jgi:hypothetical protein